MIVMTNINYLLQKYEKQTPAERTSNEYTHEQKTEKAKKHKHLILDELLNEIPFQITETQTKQIRRWIDLFNPYWKDLHRQASNETIIIAFIFIQYKQANPKIRVHEYNIAKKYELTDRKFELIQNNLIFQLMKHTPLTYTLSKTYDHEILNKKGY